VLAIEARSVGAQKPFHTDNEVGLRCFNHQVKMIQHETIGVHLPGGFAAAFVQGLDEANTVVIFAKDRLSAITPIHDVVNGSWILDAELARQAKNPAGKRSASMK
jgi:hypothetical protein